ncbi:hypothetical protein KC734_14515 [candidate division KSB1 bacterium]|nr:hypothetical protein [candidate division KSB1 bacterium]
MRSKRRVLALFWMLLPTIGSAQLQSTISLTTSLDGNAYRNYAQTADVISQANLDLSKAWLASKWSGQFYYDGYLNHFADNSSRTFSFHQIGLASQRSLGSGSGLLSLGARMSFRLDGADYEIYDFSEFAAYSNLKLPVSGLGILYAGYQVRNRSYTNLQELSNWEHIVFTRLNFSLPSRTTFIFSSELGYKNYVSQVVAEERAPVDDSSRGGRLRGNGSYFVYTEIDNPSAKQWVNSVRVSQSLFEKIGLSGYLRNRSNFGGDGRFLSGLETGYFTEDELYDDRYGYESIETGAMLSTLLPRGIMLRLGYDHYSKDYQRLALDLEGESLVGDVLRVDTRQQAWGSLEKTFRLSQFSKDLKLYLEYLFIQNKSNDLYYDFSAGVGTLGVEVSF